MSRRGQGTTDPTALDRATDRARAAAAALLPDYEDNRQQALRLLERVCLSEPFCEYSPRRSPILA